MKTHHEHKFQSVRHYTTIGGLLLCMREVCSGGKNVCRRGTTIILTDSARKKKQERSFGEL